MLISATTLASGGFVVEPLEHAALDLAAALGGGLDEHLRVVLAGLLDGGVELARRRATLLIPMLEPPRRA